MRTEMECKMPAEDDGTCTQTERRQACVSTDSIWVKITSLRTLYRRKNKLNKQNRTAENTIKKINTMKKRVMLHRGKGGSNNMKYLYHFSLFCTVQFKIFFLGGGGGGGGGKQEKQL